MARAGLTPARVVAEAAAVADDVGLDRLTLAAVAGRLGVSLPSLYKHVRGVDGLRRDLAVLALGELTTELSQATRGDGGPGRPARSRRGPSPTRATSPWPDRRNRPGSPSGR